MSEVKTAQELMEIRVEDVVDESRLRKAELPAINIEQSRDFDIDITPWEHPSPPPSPPPKEPHSLSKMSLSSLRGSQSNTHLNASKSSIAPSSCASQSQLMVSHLSSPSQNSLSSSAPKREVRKAKSSFFPKQLSRVLPGRSRNRLRADSDGIEHPSLRPKTPPLPDQYISSSESRRPKHYPYGSMSQPHSPTFQDDYIILDTNIEEMDGIVSSTVISSATASGSTSPTSAFDSSSCSYSLSDKSLSYSTLQSFPSYEFHNPFSTIPRVFTSEASKRLAMADAQISPKTIIPHSHQLPPITIPRLPDGDYPHEQSDSPSKTSWTAPESWKVLPEVEAPGEVGDLSAEEEDFISRSSISRSSRSLASNWSMMNEVILDRDRIPEIPDTSSRNGSETGHSERSMMVDEFGILREGHQTLSGSSRTTTNGTFPRNGNNTRSPGPSILKRPDRSSDARSTSTSISTSDSYLVQRPQRLAPQLKSFRLKIFRADKWNHVVNLGSHVTVKGLTEALSSKLSRDNDLKGHNLILVENGGKERILGLSERPIDIVRRRLELAGFDMTDGRDLLGTDGLSFLLKFVYKDQTLGPTTVNLSENFEFVDLTNRSLRTIPIILHQKADHINALNLSGNTMLEIPLDFIQSCTALVDLRMSNMALRRVPPNIQYCKPLTRLDVSNNRITDLNQTYLDQTCLQTLLIQNNRLENLPWHFPRLYLLRKLNLSNNRFKDLPIVICELKNLRDLDISFNMLTSLPRDIGKLVNLEHFLMVGNEVTRLPSECSRMVNLRRIDCQWNVIKDLGGISMLPKLEVLCAEHNALQELALSGGPKLQHIYVSYNEITRVSYVPGPVARPPYCLITLDISHNKISSLDDRVVAQLSLLRTLKLDHNSFKFLPEVIGSLKWLETLSCSYNNLESMPPFIGRLQKLETLEIHNNSLTELPITLWNCESLRTLNATSNLISAWQYPPIPVIPSSSSSSSTLASEDPNSSSLTLVSGDPNFSSLTLVPGDPNSSLTLVSGDPFSSLTTITSLRKASTTSQMSTNSAGASPHHILPPLALSLEKLYLGENNISDDFLLHLMLLRELKVLNLSFNDISELPCNFFRNVNRLEQLYLSGNKLQNIPTEDLPRLTHLTTLFLNGNKLQTLPHELGKVKALTVIDVGSNNLKYNINNWEFDWNWNFNKQLRYLNLSGNKKLQIKNDGHGPDGRRQSHTFSLALAGFTELTQLRVLGLMDVTITTTGRSVDIPDENEDRRIRSSESTVLGMAYGIADNLGKNSYLNMLDLVHAFPDRPGEAVFAMFGRSVPCKNVPFSASGNQIPKFLRDNYIKVFRSQLDTPRLKGRVPDALRRSFLKVNHDLHNFLFGRKHASPEGPETFVLRGGASGVVLYFAGKKMYVANVGDALAVASRGGAAHLLSKKHDPYAEDEFRRIRVAEGWRSQGGLVNDSADVSRSFGFFHLPYIINARPDISEWELSESDEFVIVGSSSLWKFVSSQTAVDIARREDDPMIAAQKLRDIVLSYGAEETTMIMVISVADLFKTDDDFRTPKTSMVDTNLFRPPPRFPTKVSDAIPAPVGHLALVFTDIRNSTHLWDVNKAMNNAWRLHNSLLRRLLRSCGGYEVKTEGDAFMCAFPTTLAAVWWCLSVQVELLNEPWPSELLQCDDGRPIYEPEGRRVVAQGLAVRMGIHCGSPLCERDPVNHRMDYFGPMVNRAARVNGIAAGGQIMCSADVMREVHAKVFCDGPPTPYSDHQTQQAIDSIRQLGIAHFPVGEVKLKGLELPEMVTVIYPKALEYRHQIRDYLVAPSDWFNSWDKLQVSQIRQLGLLCLRLEALASRRIFRESVERKTSVQNSERKVSVQTLTAANPGMTLSAMEQQNLDQDQDEEDDPLYLYGDPNILLPPLTEKSSERDMTLVLDTLAIRIANAASGLMEKSPATDVKDSLTTALMEKSLELDERTLQSILEVLGGLKHPTGLSS